MQESTLQEMFAIRQEPLPLDDKLRRLLRRLPATEVLGQTLNISKVSI